MQRWLDNFVERRACAKPISVLGAAIIDIVAQTSRLPERGDDLNVLTQETHLGGCALNITYALQQLGVSCQPYLPIGRGMWADRIRRGLNEKGISSSLEVVEGDNGWCLALIEPDGERTFISFDGVESQWQASWLSQIPSRPGVVSLSGYQLANDSEGHVLSWLEQRPKEWQVVIDLGPRLLNIPVAYRERLFQSQVILTLNEREAQWLGYETDIAAFSADLHSRTQELVIVRMGRKGCFYRFSAHQSGWVGAPEVDVIDTIGAGDTHCAGLLAGLACNLAIEDTLQLANHIAAFVVSQPGGDCSPTLKQLERMSS